MVEALDSWMLKVGPAGVVVLALAAFAEYVFPPLPGDTVVLLGGVYAVRGQQNWLLVLLAIIAGSTLGALVQFWVGALISRRVEHHPDGKTLGIRHRMLLAQMAKMRTRSWLWVLFNRFIPGVRALIFLAAGASRLPLLRTMLLGIVSSIAWNLLLLGAGVLVGGNALKLESLVDRYQTLALGVVVAAGVGVLARALAKRRGMEP